MFVCGWISYRQWNCMHTLGKSWYPNKETPILVLINKKRKTNNYNKELDLILKSKFWITKILQNSKNNGPCYCTFRLSRQKSPLLLGSHYLRGSRYFQMVQKHRNSHFRQSGHITVEIKSSFNCVFLTAQSHKADCIIIIN